MPKKSPTKPSQVITNEILNGDKSQTGVGLPPVILNLSQEIFDNATSSSKPAESSPKRPSRSGKETNSRRKSPMKARSPIRMQFPDSDSDDEGSGFAALKSFYSALNAVEQCSLLQYYSRDYLVGVIIFLSQRNLLQSSTYTVVNFYSRQLFIHDCVMSF